MIPDRGETFANAMHYVALTIWNELQTFQFMNMEGERGDIIFEAHEQRSLLGTADRSLARTLNSKVVSTLLGFSPDMFPSVPDQQS